jgi:hypothetical protein
MGLFWIATWIAAPCRRFFSIDQSGVKAPQSKIRQCQYALPPKLSVSLQVGANTDMRRYALMKKTC